MQMHLPLTRVVANVVVMLLVGHRPLVTVGCLRGLASALAEVRADALESVLSVSYA